MFGFPDDSDLTRRTPSPLEQWARSEAKSGAMVRDVLERTGAVESQTTSWQRQLLLSAGTLAVLLGMGFVAALLSTSALARLAKDADNRPGGPTSAEGSAAGIAPRLAGPFHP